MRIRSDISGRTDFLRGSLRHTLKAVLLIAAAATMTGCLGGRGKDQSFYLLTARAPATTATPINSSVGVGPVRVAPFLQRPHIVTHGGSGDLSIAENRRWGEPLEQGVQRVLLQNLTTLTGADTRNFPWTQATIPHYAVRIDVIDLDRAADGNALLEVNWILEDITHNKMLTSRREHLTVAIAAGDNPAALANAYSELFTQLAQQVAQTLLEKNEAEVQSATPAQ